MRRGAAQRGWDHRARRRHGNSSTGSSSDLQGVSEAHLLLLTHLHLDHVEGIPFFPPLWSGDFELDVWGPPSPVATLADPLPIAATFPLEVKDIPGTITFRDVPEEEWKSGSVRLRAQPIIHPGPTVGYRLEEDGRSLAYLPDHEPARGADFESRAPEWISGLSLADEVDVLIRRAVHRRGIPREDRLGALKPYACHRLCTPRESRASRALPP